MLFLKQTQSISGCVKYRHSHPGH